MEPASSPPGRITIEQSDGGDGRLPAPSPPHPALGRAWSGGWDAPADASFAPAAAAAAAADDAEAQVISFRPRVNKSPKGLNRRKQSKAAAAMKEASDASDAASSPSPPPEEEGGGGGRAAPAARAGKSRPRDEEQPADEPEPASAPAAWTIGPAPRPQKGERDAMQTSAAEGRGGGASSAAAAAAAPARPSGPCCCECEDQAASLLCVQCDERFCKPCWGSQHRRGNRAAHKVQPLLGEVMARAPQPQEPSNASSSSSEGAPPSRGPDLGPLEPASAEPPSTSRSGAAPPAKQRREGGEGGGGAAAALAAAAAGEEGGDTVALQSSNSFVPMRLTEQERKLLSLLEGALEVSEYTDHVDVLGYYSKLETMVLHSELLLQELAGLFVVDNGKLGAQKFGGAAGSTQKQVYQRKREEKQKRQGYNGRHNGHGREREQEDCGKHARNAEFFQKVFEVGRRFKVMNPGKMRGTYGKLMHILQDSRKPEVQRRLGFDPVIKIQTTIVFLRSEYNLTDTQLETLFYDKLLRHATLDVAHETAAGHGSAEEVSQRKQVAITALMEKYAEPEGGSATMAADSDDVRISGEDLRRVLDSLSDSTNYLANNMAPVGEMLGMLRQNFERCSAEYPWSLSLSPSPTSLGYANSGKIGQQQQGGKYGQQQQRNGGRKCHGKKGGQNFYGNKKIGGGGGYNGYGGNSNNWGGISRSKLSHSHTQQYDFVTQTLILWKLIQVSLVLLLARLLACS